MTEFIDPSKIPVPLLPTMQDAHIIQCALEDYNPTNGQSKRMPILMRHVAGQIEDSEVQFFRCGFGASVEDLADRMLDVFDREYNEGRGCLDEQDAFERRHDAMCVVARMFVLPYKGEVE